MQIFWIQYGYYCIVWSIGFGLRNWKQNASAAARARLKENQEGWEIKGAWRARFSIHTGSIRLSGLSIPVSETKVFWDVFGVPYIGFFAVGLKIQASVHDVVGCLLFFIYPLFVHIWGILLMEWNDATWAIAQLTWWQMRTESWSVTRALTAGQRSSYREWWSRSAAAASSPEWRRSLEMQRYWCNYSFHVCTTHIWYIHCIYRLCYIYISYHTTHCILCIYALYIYIYPFLVWYITHERFALQIIVFLQMMKRATTFKKEPTHLENNDIFTVVEETSVSKFAEVEVQNQSSNWSSASSERLGGE